MRNVETVGEIYADFGRGNVPAILERLAEDVEWEYGAASTDVPWLLPRRGRAAVMGFFEALGALEFESFEVARLVDGGDLVVGLIDLTARVKATGLSVTEQHEVHLWHFDERGRVVRFRHRADTHAHWKALHAR